MQDHLIISLDDVAVTLNVGVPQEERAVPQRVLISVTIAVQEPPTFKSDAALHDTIDYTSIIAFMQDGLPAQGPWVLIETIAEAVTSYGMGLLARVAWVEARVKKPSVLGAHGMTQVCLRRHADPARRRHGLAVTEASG
jgi:dihydroneopterin aldolase